MLTIFFLQNLDEIDLEDTWFLQNDATCPTTNAPIHVLQEQFGEMIILSHTTVSWPLRSCDITSLDYFFWNDLKSIVYGYRFSTFLVSQPLKSQKIK